MTPKTKRNASTPLAKKAALSHKASVDAKASPTPRRDGTDRIEGELLEADDARASSAADVVRLARHWVKVAAVT